MVRNTPLNIFVNFLLLINIDLLKKERLVISTRLTCSRVRERWIPVIEFRRMLLERNLYMFIRDPKYKHKEIKRIRHVDTMEILDISRKNNSRSKTI
jgi:hypothetical protein